MGRRSEKEVGILCWIPRGEQCGSEAAARFKGLLKQRFSDFHVHEIDESGQRMHLTSFALPESQDQEASLERMEGDEALLQWISPATKDQIIKLQSLENPGLETKLEINVSSADKANRTKIHRWLDNFDKLGGETIEKDGEKFIIISRQSIRDKRKPARRPHNRAKFTHCVLYKQGIDTSDAINYLCRKLRIHPRHITFAGTKDKQAKTVQGICFSNMEASRLLRVNEYSTQSKLGNFIYKDKPLHLGQLQGNHFKILLRDVEAESNSSISSTINCLSINGFLNYFGLQRFGSFSISTHVIGKAILQMDWLKVFDLILEPNEGRDRSYMKKAKKLWLEKRDPVKAMKEIPQHHMSIEASLLFGLSKYYATGDHWSSFCVLPRNMRTLYFHSYQSFLWNHLASHRIEKYGLQPVPGDLVFLDSESELDTEMILDEVECGGLDNSTRENDREKPSASKINAATAKLKTLTEDDLPNYTIFDVIIPIEGSEIKIPDSCNLKPFWNQLLTENGVAEGFPNFRPRLELPKGSFRKVVVLPKNVGHQIIPYNAKDDLDKFIPSDYDLMLEKEKASSGGTMPPTDANVTEISTKDKTCVIVEFSLPSSSYATMALREILEDVDEGKREGESISEGAKRSLEGDEVEQCSSGGVVKKLKHSVLVLEAVRVDVEFPKTSSSPAGEQ